MPSFKALAAKTTTRAAITADEARQQVTSVVRRVVPQLLAAGRDDDAEVLLEAAVDVGRPDASAADFAAFVAERGTAEKALTRWETRRRFGGPNLRTAEFALLNLYRLTGNAPKALEAALWVTEVRPAPDGTPPRTYPVRDIYRNVLLAEAGRWGEVVDPPLPAVAPGNPYHFHPALGTRLVRLKLAGKGDELDGLVRTTVTDLLKAPPTPYSVPAAVNALLIAGRPDDAAKLAESPALPAAARLDLAFTRGRFADALALPGGAEGVAALKEKKPVDWLAWQLGRAKLLARLGKEDDARKAFEEAAEFAGKTPANMAALVLAESAAGMTDRAFERTYKAIDAGMAAWAQTPSPFAALFGTNADVALVWWNALRSGIGAEKPRSATLKLVRGLLAGTATDDEYADAVKLLDAPFNTPPAAGQPVVRGGGGVVEERRLSAKLAAALAAGKDADAEVLLKALAEAATAGPAARREPVGLADGGRFGFPIRSRPWLLWGQFLADRGRQKEAADVYLRGWERFPDAAHLLYLSGRAVAAAGDAAGGEKRAAEAFRVPLGNETAWAELLAEAMRLERPDDVKRAAAGLSRVFWGRSPRSPLVLELLAKAHRAAGDYSAAAAAHDRFIHAISGPGSTIRFTEPREYLAEPLRATFDRGQAALKAGKTADAAALFRAYFAASPTATGVAPRVVPAFDKLGAKEDAEAFYRTAKGALEAILKEFPDAPVYHNDLAWLEANCRRDLDDALAHAEKATAAAPDNANYLDTLAEVHFRRGNADKAAVVMARVLEKTKATPKGDYHRKQLARFKAGDPSTAPPGLD